MVAGSLYRASDKDGDGKPRVVKAGPNAGKPAPQFFFRLAIPKGAERHWAETSWGQILWAEGHKAFPQAAQSPAFAWKVMDGDSAVPNKKGKKPNEQEGYPGNWIVTFTSAYAPRVCNHDGSQYLTEEDAIVPGYYVQVAGSTAGNASQQTPGIFVNPSIVSLQAYGERIETGVDASAVGFGQGVALPPGASTAPPAGMKAPPATPGTPPPPPAAAGMAPGAPPPYTPPPTVVAPHPGILAVPVAPPPPPPAAPVAPPPPAAGPRMTAKAGGTTYAQYRAAGWTDEQMRAEGVME